jgi:hypothetical protein
MPANRVLYFSAHQIQAYRWQGGSVSQEGSFDSEAPGPSFDDYLRENKRSVFSIVANVADEGFHHETIPFLQSRDRTTVVNRRLNQLFQNSPFTLAISLGYEKTRRKDEKLMLFGLTNPALFDPALKAMRAAEVRLSGIFTLPLLSGALLDRLKIPNTRCLLVSFQDHTIRQSYFDGGSLIISRLAPVSDSSSVGVTQSITAEVTRFQQYLLSQRTIGRNERLDAHVLVHSSFVQSAAGGLPGSEVLAFHLHDLEAVARKVGCRGDLPDNRSQALFAHLACAAAPRQQFAPAPLRKEFRLWQASRALFAAGVATLIAALVFAGKTWIDVRDFEEQAAAKIADATTLDSRYQGVVRTFPPVPVAKEAMRALVARYGSIEGETSLPQDMLAGIASALDRSPDVEISRIEWAVGNEGSTSQTPRDSSGGQITLTIEGSISAGTSGTARDLLAEFERFTQNVLGPPDAGQELLVLQQPFDVTSGTSLRSGSSALSTLAPRKFTLALVRKGRA